MSSSLPRGPSYAGPMPDFADATTTELERKARALMWVAGIETITYLVLFYFWLIQPNDAGTKITGSIHGFVWMAFVAMVLMITNDIEWSWPYSIAVIVLGPIGGIMVWDRIRRHGVPAAKRAHPTTPAEHAP